MGTLYIVATPIGNMGDITVRALETLKNVDMIAAEDTRQTMKLLTRYDIKNTVVSYFEHNKAEKGIKLIEEIKSGKDIALVSDAGSPCISDPGQDLVRLAVENDIKVTMVPGPCAAIDALAISALDTSGFVFEGFIGTENKQKEEVFKRLSNESRTTVIYEAPHRLLRTLKELEPVTKERCIAVCRELTKLYEEVRRGSACEHIAYFSKNDPRGEFVLVIEGKKAEDTVNADTLTEDEKRNVYNRVNEMTEEGIKRSEAIKNTAKEMGLTRNSVYSIYEEIKNS